jgi:hypothetical protein
MHHLVEHIEELRNRGIGFRSVSDGLVDTIYKTLFRAFRFGLPDDSPSNRTES